MFKQLIKYSLFLVLLISAKSYGADTKSFAYYDSLTYDLYIRQEWKKLTVTGKEALKDGYDYYYLRVRIGIAYYKLNNYMQSITQFRKALQFNSGDPTATGYLYNALLESGMREEAALFACRQQTVLSAEGYKKKPLEFIYAEGGYTPDAINGHQAIDLIGNDSIYGEEDTYADQTYFHAGISLNVLPAFSCYLGYSNLWVNKENHFVGNTIINHLDSIVPMDYGKEYFYSSPGKIFDTLIPYKVEQHEFYIAASWIPMPNLSITPAFHYISGTSQSFTSVLQLIQRIDTAYYLASDQTLHFFNNTVSRYVISQQGINYRNYVISLAALKVWRNFSFGLYGTYGRLANIGKQVQAGVSATWYPFGNINLYATTSLTGFANGSDKRLIYDQTITLKIVPNLWLEGLLTLGNLSLYNEKNAFVAFNLADRIKIRKGANLVITLGRHIDLSLIYRFYTKEFDFFYYKKSPSEIRPILVTATTTYYNHSLLGGLKWKF